jgi:uncharacterized coiled-coil protein SlyX
MTLEERVEFLHQSIESHNQQLGELTESQARTDRQIAMLTERMNSGFERMDRGFERVQLNFDRLTTAMLGLTAHVEKHAERLDRLEDE